MKAIYKRQKESVKGEDNKSPNVSEKTHLRLTFINQLNVNLKLKLAALYVHFSLRQ